MKRLISVALLTGALCVAQSQPASVAQRAGTIPKETYATMHLEAQLGSFRLIDGEGRVEFNFVGTVLLSQIKGTTLVTGDVVLQYDERGKKVYQGKGKVVVAGSFRAIQWFGKDMRLVWFGQGVARLSGEFYKDRKTGQLKTGDLWYDDPAEKIPWPGQGSIDHRLPKWEAPQQAQPRRRGN